MAGLAGGQEQGLGTCMLNLLPTVLSAGIGASYPSAESWGPFCQLYPDLVTATPCTGKKHFPRASVSPPTHPTCFLGCEGRSGQGRAGQSCRDQLGCVCVGGFPL